jgi:hypothetical protein
LISSSRSWISAVATSPSRTSASNSDSESFSAPLPPRRRLLATTRTTSATTM